MTLRAHVQSVCSMHGNWAHWMESTKSAATIGAVVEYLAAATHPELPRLRESVHPHRISFRNAQYEGIAFALASEFFDLPRTGTLEFDYVSTARPAATIRPLSSRRFMRMMLQAGLITEEQEKKFENIDELGDGRSGSAAKVECSASARCSAASETAADARGGAVSMAKSKCIHPERPVSKACGDCPRRG